jgi:DNA-binding transcriptional ArsR family regulator
MHPFEIVAEPVRRRIVEVLAVGEHEVGILNDVIATEFSVSRSAVSHHLRILRDTKVVDVRGDGAQGRLYSLQVEFLEDLDEAVGALFRLHDHRYGALMRRAPLHPAPSSRTPHRLRGRGRRGLSDERG